MVEFMSAVAYIVLAAISPWLLVACLFACLFALHYVYVRLRVLWRIAQRELQ